MSISVYPSGLGNKTYMKKYGCVWPIVLDFYRWKFYILKTGTSKESLHHSEGLGGGGGGGGGFNSFCSKPFGVCLRYFH